MLTQEEKQLQEKLEAKQKQLASIVGEKEAQRLMDRALKMVVEGKKSITDIIE